VTPGRKAILIALSLVGIVGFLFDHIIVVEWMKPWAGFATAFAIFGSLFFVATAPQSNHR
jgi:heme/copper-type cytochrome/quinol oxidase subunit 3